MKGETACSDAGRRQPAQIVWPCRNSLLIALILVIFHALAPSLSSALLLAQGQAPAAGKPPPSGSNVSSSLAAQPSQSPANQNLLVTVVDENGVAVASAHLALMRQASSVARGETDFAGRREFHDLAPGVYSLRVEKELFYVTTVNNVQVGETGSLEVTLNHTQEYVESVNVVYSPPAIDPQNAAASETLSSQDIINLPYTVTRDIRYALPLLPGVVQDAFGQVHVDGSSASQIFDQLDGFNISDPINGLFNMRVSVDALQSVELQDSRYSAQYGKGSSGVLSLRTGMGDNHFRFSATDFVPSIQNRKGIHINTWTPRATFSGPLRKNKGWFLEALDGDYDLHIVQELPRGQDQNPAMRISNLSKAQVNLNPSNILTATVLVNGYRADHAGLSLFNPMDATVNQRNAAYFFALRDQHFFRSSMLLETGLALSVFHQASRPLGNQPYIITPDQNLGSFFESGDGHASRLQGIANLFLPPRHWNGRHEFEVGLDLDRITDRQSFVRRPVSIRREDGTLSRQISFLGGASFGRTNFETSGYAQDRWSSSDRWLVQPGVRFDWDALIRDFLVSPRLAASYLLTRDGNTKLVGGMGLYNDATNLDILTRSLTGQRLDTFYDPTGTTPVGTPVITSFLVNTQNLKVPRFLNWSAGVERKMPYTVYLTLQYVRRGGRHGWVFFNQGAGSGGQSSGLFELKDAGQDRYDAAEVSLRHTFKGNHEVFLSYTRSAARSNAVLGFSIDNLVFSQQAGGPLAWDTPNRVLSWGFLPLPRGFTLAYSCDWRDGYPFSLVNQDQQLVGPPGSRRFPSFFSLNLQLERRFRILGFVWAIRGGFNDITNRQNPFAVDNNVDSSRFLTFSGIQGRVLTGRIRFLGRK